MPPSKKKRGKLRKSAAAAAAARAQGKNVGSAPPQSDSTRSQSSDPRAETVISNDDANGAFYAFFVALKGGDSAATRLLADNSPIINPIIRGRLVEFGLIDVVLRFLFQCEEKEMSDAILTRNATKTESVLIKELSNSPVDDPALWIGLLANLTDDGSLPTEQYTHMCRLQLATAIGPIVKCICNPSEMFFKSKAHWYSSICPFLHLLDNISQNRECNIALLQYKGLVKFCVQSLFWRSHRPDIVESVKGSSADLNNIYSPAMNIIEEAICIYKQLANGTSGIKAVGITPIRRKHHMLFVLGLIHQLQTKFQGYENSYNRLVRGFQLLNELVDAGCVDKDVIYSLVRLANSQLDYSGAVYASTAISSALAPFIDGEEAPSDNRFAFAIDQGFLQLCLTLILRFQNRSLHYDALEETLKKLVNAVSSVSMSLKSFKAVGRQCNSVMKALQEAEDCLDKGHYVFNAIKKIVLVIDGIEKYSKRRYREVVLCHRCGLTFKSLGQHIICGCCQQVTYCSKKCQQEAWEDDHGECCKKSSSVNRKISKQQDALKQNVTAAVDKLVAENWMNIISDATLQGYHIMDCVVVIDLVSSFSMKVMLTADLLPERKSALDKFVGARSKGQLPSICTSNRFDEYGVFTGTSRKLHKIEGFDSWKAAQVSYQNGELTDEMNTVGNAGDLRKLFFHHK